MNRLVLPLLLLVAAVGNMSAISPSSRAGTAGAPPFPTQATSHPALELPRVTDDKPRDFSGLHNVVAYHDGYLSGSVPGGDAGFDTLVAMGVKTIISVDGAEPDLARAKARGIRYIHLPIGYNGFDEHRKLELLRATRDAIDNGPVYIHCHHGKHRSAGAAATVAVSLGWLTPQQAVERMKVSGTATDYTGLYSCTAMATAIEVAVVDSVPSDFPEVSHPASFVKSMVEIDLINDRLKAIEKAGWTVPVDHPDLIPVAEAGRMADLFRFASESEKAKSNPDDFAAALKDDVARIESLEALLAADRMDAKQLSGLFKAIQASCKDCHAKYRD